MMLRALALAVLLAPLTVAADTLTLKAGHPQRYVVKKGDTLWDIAGRFLEEPWRWPQIWRANPQIVNPDLIYPGDELRLTYEGGEPVVRARRAVHPTVRLSPRVRTEPLAAQPIPAIPIDAIHPFLRRPRVVSQDEYDAAPYIVSMGKESLIGRAGQRVYVRGLGEDIARRYAVYRLGQAYVDPAAEDGEGLLGYEALRVADAVLLERGDPVTMVLTSSSREVLVGDRLMAVSDEDVDRNFLPRAPERPVSGQIISVVDGVSQIGQYQVVVINRGRRDGLEPGHVMAVYQRGEKIVDKLARPPADAEGERPTRIELDPAKQGGAEGFAQAATDLVVAIQEGLAGVVDAVNPHPKPYQLVKLPDVRAGTVMVFRPFERMSYALVMEARRAIHVEDVVTNP